MSVEQEKQKEVKNGQEQKSSSKSHVIYIIIIILLLGGIGYLGFKTKTTSEKLVQTTIILTETSNQKDSVLFQLDSLYTEFEALKTDNDSINKQIEAQQAEIKNLYVKLKKANNANRAEIDKYKQELVGLQEILQSKYKVIDSLNSANTYLSGVNTQLQTTIEEAKKIDVEKTQELEKLNDKVTKAAVLKANNVVTIPMSAKAKPIFKAKKVANIGTSCVIAENAVVEPGAIIVYVRITRKDGVVLTQSQSNTFTFDGEEILFSEKREISYQNKDTKFDIFYKPSAEEITPGTYKVQLFAQGKEIGATNFVLN